MKLTNEINKMLKTYAHEIQYVDAIFEIHYMMQFGDKKWEEAYKIAPAFFTLSRRSMLNGVFTTLSKLLKHSKNKDMNLHAFLCKLESNYKKIKGIDNDEFLRAIKKHKTNISEKKDIIEKISCFRDKVISHYDKEYFASRDVKGAEVNISAEEIRDIIEYISELVNEFYYQINKSEIYFRYTNYDDIKSLMNILIETQSNVSFE